jgi:hypothetical protein
MRADGGFDNRCEARVQRPREAAEKGRFCLAARIGRVAAAVIDANAVAHCTAL